MNTPYAFKIGKNADPEMDGVRGRVGQFVFRRLNGITIVSRRPKKPTSQTEAQQHNRQRFRQATEFAKKEMMDVDRKVYYKAMADKYRLRNAYTAAITAYMNRPETVVQYIDPLQVSRANSKVKKGAGVFRSRLPTNRNPIRRSPKVLHASRPALTEQYTRAGKEMNWLCSSFAHFAPLRFSNYFWMCAF